MTDGRESTTDDLDWTTDGRDGMTDDRDGTPADPMRCRNTAIAALSQVATAAIREWGGIRVTIRLGPGAAPSYIPAPRPGSSVGRAAD